MLAALPAFLMISPLLREHAQVAAQRLARAVQRAGHPGQAADERDARTRMEAIARFRHNAAQQGIALEKRGANTSMQLSYPIEPSGHRPPASVRDRLGLLRNLDFSRLSQGAPTATMVPATVAPGDPIDGVDRHRSGRGAQSASFDRLSQTRR